MTGCPTASLQLWESLHEPGFVCHVLVVFGVGVRVDSFPTKIYERRVLSLVPLPTGRALWQLRFRRINLSLIAVTVSLSVVTVTVPVTVIRITGNQWNRIQNHNSEQAEYSGQLETLVDRITKEYCVVERERESEKKLCPGELLKIQLTSLESLER